MIYRYNKLEQRGNCDYYFNGIPKLTPWPSQEGEFNCYECWNLLIRYKIPKILVIISYMSATKRRFGDFMLVLVVRKVDFHQLILTCTLYDTSQYHYKAVYNVDIFDQLLGIMLL